MMVPAGDATVNTVTALAEQLDRGDTIIDGGNTHFKDDIRRARELTPKGLQSVDVGTGDGIWGAERGYCLMVGGTPDSFLQLIPLFRTLAPGAGTALTTVPSISPPTP